MKRRKYNDSDYIEAAKHSTSIAGMCRYMGRSPFGANYQIMHKKIEQLHIDTSHFLGCGWNVGLKFNPKKNYTKNIDEILVENSSYTCSNHLRNRLFREGIKKRECEICGNTEWNNKPIPLQIHHKNGKHNDNRLENLQVLCPNCHAQTTTYAGKNRK